MDPTKVLVILGLATAGLGYLLLNYFLGYQQKTAQAKILERLLQQNTAIMAICGKVVSSFSHHGYSKRFAEDSNTKALYHNAMDIKAASKNIRGCITRLIPIHPEYSDYHKSIDDGIYHFTSVGLAVNTMKMSIEHFAKYHGPHKPDGESFLQLCSLLQRQLTEARELVSDSVADLNDLKRILDKAQASADEKAAT